MSYIHYTEEEIAHEKQQIMDYITTYLVENQVVPTIYEIRDTLGIPYGRVWRLLHAMMDEGTLLHAHGDCYKHRIYRVPGYKIVKVE